MVCGGDVKEQIGSFCLSKLWIIGPKGSRGDVLLNCELRCSRCPTELDQFGCGPSNFERGTVAKEAGYAPARYAVDASEGTSDEDIAIRLQSETTDTPMFLRLRDCNS